MKKIALILIAALVIFVFATAAAPVPPAQPTIVVEVINGLPTTLNVGESYTIEIQLTSDVPFNTAGAKPDPYYPGKFVVFEKPGGDRTGDGTTATMFLTVTAKDSTAKLGGPVPMAFVVGARYGNGLVVGERVEFSVDVP